MSCSGYSSAQKITYSLFEFPSHINTPPPKRASAIMPIAIDIIELLFALVEGTIFGTKVEVGGNEVAVAMNVFVGDAVTALT